MTRDRDEHLENTTSDLRSNEHASAGAALSASDETGAAKFIEEDDADPLGHFASSRTQHRSGKHKRRLIAGGCAAAYDHRWRRRTLLHVRTFAVSQGQPHSQAVKADTGPNGNVR